MICYGIWFVKAVVSTKKLLNDKQVLPHVLSWGTLLICFNFNFKGVNHLSEEYFSDIGNVLTFESHLSNLFVKYHKGTFSNTTKDFNKKIDILHLDCDLYQSYLDVLNGLYKNVKKGGSIIFDEYYSLKYPGARIAVNEFFFNQSFDRFEKYITQDSFERWCVVK